MRLKLVLFSGLCISAATQPALPASLNEFNQLVIFGDSLSDVGNSYLSTGSQTLGSFGTNYWSGRFTDGPTTFPATNGPIGNWVDQFSALSRIPNAAPSLAGGTNYAFGGATTGSAQPNDISNQVGQFLGSYPPGALPAALYVVWGGANDLLNAGNNPAASADALYGNIVALAANGAKTFLWFDLPGAMGPAGVFNQQWSVDLRRLNESGIDVIGVNVSALFSRIDANPAAYGFTNIVDPAQGKAGINPNEYLFWDTRRHPTTSTDALIANLALNDLIAAPEPVNLYLVLSGLLGLTCTRRLLRKFSD